MYKYNKYLFILSLITMVACFWNKDKFPERLIINSGLSDEPIQQQTENQKFSVNFNEVSYLVEPLFEYELYGMLVSYNHHEGGSLHEKWNDHLNVSDFCVVWGGNAKPEWLNKIDFWNGQFTCNFETRDNEVWQNFNIYKISNNHLLSDDPSIRKQLEDISIGDQVRIKGYLATYSNDTGFKRSSSTNRMDTGNGACETLYVTEFELLSKMSNNWRRFLPISIFLFILSLIIYFKAPVRFK